MHPRRRRFWVSLAGFLALAPNFLNLGAQTSPATITLAATPSPATAQPGVTVLTLVASSMPAGTITPANLSLTLQVAAGATGPNLTAQVSAYAAIPGAGGRITFQVLGPNVTAPTPYLVSVSGQTSTGVAFASSKPSALTINPPALILSITPSSAAPGQTIQVSITGQYTNYVQGSTTANFGAGISVGGAALGQLGPVTVTSPTTAVAQLTIDPSAAVGARTVTVATGTQQAALVNGFSVGGPPGILSITPNNGQQGQQGLSVTITGLSTHFAQAATLANFGAGITVASLTVNSATSAGAVLNIDPAAATGPRNVTVTIGADVFTLPNGFTVTPGTPVITLVSPSSGLQGQQNFSVAIMGQFTHFAQGTTTASFGSGISVTSLTVIDSTAATAILSIDPTAALSTRNVTLTTGTEVVTLPNGFTVNQGNQAPVVSAGPDQSITWPNSAVLSGSVADDGLPLGANLTTTWTGVGASTPQWVQLAPTGGPIEPRFGHTAAIDPNTGSMIIFGGATPSSPPGTNDVLVLTNADGLGGTPQWLNLQTVPDPVHGLPRRRSFHSMVYDSNSNRIIVFGGCFGNCGPVGNDVWVLTNANGIGGSPAWTELFPTGGPPAPRNGHTAVYDAGSNSMIVFGGAPASHAGFAEVWVLSNANGLGGTPTWTQLNLSGAFPATRIGATAVYDSADNRMIVFAGDDGSTVTNAVWVLTNANGLGGTPGWLNLIAEGSAGSPPPREDHTAVYDPRSNRITIFDGRIPLPAFDYKDTWVLVNANGIGPAAWSQVFPQGSLPAERDDHTAVLNTTSGRMIAFGGGNTKVDLNDVWVLANANGGVIFSNPIQTEPDVAGTLYPVSTTASFTGPGTYQLRLTASDSVLASSSDVTVTVSPPPNLLSIAPAAGQEGQQNLPVTITGQSTHFVQGTTTANFGAGITVASLTVNSATSAGAVLNIDPSAVTGARNVTVTTGAEVVTLTNGFTVTPGTPVITLISPSSGLQGQQNMAVVITGQFTHFAQGTTTASFGSGISVTSLTVIDSTAATAILSIDPTAALGTRNVTLTTGTEVVTLPNGFTVNQGNQAPVVSAGPDQSITWPNSAVLSGSVADDGLPLGANLTTTWTGVGASTPQWVQLAPTGGAVEVRAGHTAAIDPNTNRMIIFGGGTPSSTAGTNDVLVLTNADGLGAPQWLHLQALPDPVNGLPRARALHSMVYDSNNNRIIVFGGCFGNCAPLGNDVWVLTNANGVGGTPVWQQLFPSGVPPAPRSEHTAVYDAGSNSMIVFGGAAGTRTGFAEVWVLSNANGLGGTPVWTQVNPSGVFPPARRDATAVYDSVHNRMIVFGGFLSDLDTATNAVWVLTNANGLGGTPGWINLIAEGSIGSAPPRADHTTVYDPKTNRMTTFGGRVLLPAFVNYNDTWVLVNANGIGTAAWSQVSPPSSLPPERADHTAVLNTLSGRMIAFGGTNGPVDWNDVWVLTNAIGGVVFSNPSQTEPDVAGTLYPVSTTASFTGPGTYQLRLTASDSVLASSSDVTVTVSPPPNLLSIAPAAGQEGQQNLPVTITGQSTHFVQGTTTASFGAGITVATLTVNSATSATAVLNIDPSAVTGARNVTVTTGAEVVTLTNGFTVTPGTPVITLVNPNYGQQGQINLSVTITGQFTHWLQGTTTASFGAGITVNSVTVAGATSLTANLSMATGAAMGPRTVTVTTGTEVASLAGGFVVSAAVNQAPTVSAGPNQTLSLGVAEVAFTEFVVPTGDNPYLISTGADGNLWFTENMGTNIGRITPAGSITLFPFPSVPTHGAGRSAGGITAGPDGNLWTAEYFNDKIGRITTDGTITEFSLTSNSQPFYITAGPDGNLWFTEALANKIGRITTAGVITEFPIPSAGSYYGSVDPQGITAGQDGNLWFSEPFGNQIGRITPTGVITEFPIPTSGSYPTGIAAGPDGNLWFTENLANKIGRITSAGAITEYSLPPSGSGPGGITAGPDGNLWFTQDYSTGTQIGRITTGGVITLFTAPTPSSRMWGITAGPDGNLWFVEGSANKIGVANYGVFLGPATGTLNGTVTDDGLPAGATLTAAWHTSSGPSSVTFSNPTATFPDVAGQVNPAVTSTTFTAPGIYVLGLTASDSLLSGSSNTTITVNPPQVATILSVSQNTGQQGQQNLSVEIIGQFTHFVQGTTAANFGTGITVASLTVNSPTAATAVLNIDPAAVVDPRRVTLTTGAEMATLGNGFTVTALTPVLTTVSPNSGQQGQQRECPVDRRK